MFSGATNFNQPLDKWDTSNVTDMSEMFNNAVSFNRPLNSWNTKNVENMKRMFYYAKSFDQPLDKWNLSNIWSMNMIFYESGMTRDNYCKLFKGAYWSYWKNKKIYLGKYFNCD